KGLSLRRLYGPSGSCRVTPPTVNQQTERDRHQQVVTRRTHPSSARPCRTLGHHGMASMAILRRELLRQRRDGTPRRSHISRKETLDTWHGSRFTPASSSPEPEPPARHDERVR